MRNRFVVTYDVADAKRLRLMYRRMKGFGDPLQLSVFICDLSPTEKILLQERILETINQREDRVLIIDIGPVSGRALEAVHQLGRVIELPEQRRAMIV